MLKLSRIAASLLLLTFVFNTHLRAQERAAQNSSAPSITAAATAQRVRFTAPPDITAMRLELYTPDGQRLFDSGFKTGTVFDWKMQDESGQRYAAGTYLCVVSAKSISGRVSRKSGTLSIAVDGVVSLQQAETAQQGTLDGKGSDGTLSIMREDEAVTTTSIASTSTEGEITRGKGALSFRVGDFYTGDDSEQMRLTEEGNLGIGTEKPQARLDVNGVIRAQGGIQFSNGTLLNVSPEGGLRVTSPAGKSNTFNVTANATPVVVSTPNRITKWIDSSGTLGNSTIFEDDAGNVGIGTTAPTSLLDLNKNQNTGTTFNIDNGFTTPGNGAYSGFFFKQGGEYRFFFGSVNDGNTVQAGGPGAVLLWNYTQGPTIFAAGNAERLRINATGNVGIGTANPQAKLDVAGDIKLSGNGSGLVFPDGSVLKSATTNGVPSGTGIINAINDPATTGVISDARLSTNVARLDSANTFNGKQSVNGSVIVTESLISDRYVQGQSGTFTNLLSTSALVADSNTLFVNAATHRVGIGTYLPESKLQVEGMVQSTSGGYKFPDASVQTTAAGKVFTTLVNNSVQLSPRGTSWSSVLQLQLPAGSYLLTATVQFENTANLFAQNNSRIVQCQLTDGIWTVRLAALNNPGDQMPLTMQGVVTQFGTGPVDLFCGVSDGGTDRSYVFVKTRRFTAVKIADLVTQP